MALGLYVSRASGRIDSAIDIEKAISDARDEVAVVRVVDELFDADVQARMVKDVADAELDAIVLAGHSVQHYATSLSGQQLRERLIGAGLNPNRIVIANILEQVALVHPEDRAGATAKARAVINVAVSSAKSAKPVEGHSTEPRHAVLILGVNTEALVVAQRLLQLGYSVVLADRADGRARATEASRMRATAAYILGHPKAEFIDNAHMLDGHGWLGDFEITLHTDGNRATFRVGGIVLARPDVREWIEEVRQHFKVDIDDDGNARSVDPETHPAETIDPGIVVVPIRQKAEPVRNIIAAADSAAMALVLRLSADTTVHFSDVSSVDETLCGGCASCVRTCAFGACYIGDDGLSHVDERRCRACGKCVVSCPVGARDIMSSPHSELIRAVRSMAEAEVPGERVLGFLCGGCGYPAADSASEYVGQNGTTYPVSFLPIRIPCGGRLDTLHVLEAFRAGFEGVVVFRCREGHCHNLIGNVDMDRRVNLLRTVLRSRNLDDSRLRIVDISPFEGERFVEQVNELYAALGGLANGKGGPQ